MFGRILVPLDGSEKAERICGWVIGLARSLGSEAGRSRPLPRATTSRLLAPGIEARHTARGA